MDGWDDLLNTNFITENQSYDSKENLENLEKILTNSKNLVKENGSNFILFICHNIPVFMTSTDSKFINK